MAAAQSTITITGRVTPRSGRDEVMGRKVFEDGVQAVCVRVTAAPDGGKANKAVCKAVASSLGVPKTAVEVVSGHTARRKQLSISANAITGAAVQEWLSSLPSL